MLAVFAIARNPNNTGELGSQSPATSITIAPAAAVRIGKAKSLTLRSIPEILIAIPEPLSTYFELIDRTTSLGY